MSNQYKIGDQVRLLNSSVSMVVEGADHDSVECVWLSADKTVQRQTFMAATVCLVEPPRTTTHHVKGLV